MEQKTNHSKEILASVSYVLNREHFNVVVALNTHEGRLRLSRIALWAVQEGVTIHVEPAE